MRKPTELVDHSLVPKREIEGRAIMVCSIPSRLSYQCLEALHAHILQPSVFRVLER